MASERSDLWRLVSLARPEVPLLVVATVALLIGSGLGLVYPIAVQQIIDLVVEGGEQAQLDWIALALVAVFLVSNIAVAIRAWLFTVAGERVVARLRTDLYSSLIRQDIGFFDTSRTGELTNRLASDTTVLQNSVTVNLSMGLRFALSGLGGIVLMFIMSPLLSLVTLSVVPVVAIGAAIYGRMLRELSVEVQDALATTTEVAEETFAAVRTVRAFAQEDDAVARYGAAVQDSYRVAAKRAALSGVFQGVAGFGGYGAVALVIWFGGGMVLDGAMSVGDLTAFLLYTLNVAFSLGALAGLWGDFMKAVGASRRVFQLLDQRAPLEASGGPELEVPRGELVFDDVTFTYPARPEQPVLDGLSLQVPAGSVVALVGPSGAGKSTIARLLTRYYDPERGRITIDGVPITEVDPRSLRRRIGLVAQEPVLFASSLRDNIRYGRPDATDVEVEAAAEAANALEFIRAFPEGLDTSVGERGVRLSGGQKQRIAIARALLKDPRILVLDEATSALDTESEHLVQEALDRLMEGRTTLVIAHRLSTVKDANKVVVLDGGQVVEAGTHDELVAADGLYKRLVERQFATDPAYSQLAAGA